MVVTKLCGLILILIGIYIFKIGLTIDDKVGHRLMNIRIIGAAFLLFGAGIGLLFTSKSICETLGIFC